jgi:hypothetical protein
MAFINRAGNVVPVQLDVDGSVPVVDMGGGDGEDLPSLLSRLVWEMREMRRVYCEATDQFFREYPGDD